MAIPLLHHGMLITGVPYSAKELSTTTGGGTPYGPSHVALNDSDEGLTQDEKVIAQTLGKRIATIALKLKPAHS